MSSLSQVQREIADLINADERFERRGARAFPFDAGDIWAEEGKWLAAATGGIHVSILTESGRYLGDSPDGRGGRGVRIALKVAMVCTEDPVLRQGLREGGDPATALQVAELLAVKFNDDQIRFKRFVQDAEPKSGTISVAAEFETSATITTPTE